ncbi:PAS fold protein [Thalassoglobus neptunius]|uniref:histidine kinase n=1 Tax=Thalassoglobus neptunius TaxID=1938619 RepID=A0A5C5W7S2_9PLAN|nr:PAS domain-containing protein [Thalassoglobus neptunius]TWT46948.1 PAS fold protein [Thalassoglobus neptunius]
MPYSSFRDRSLNDVYFRAVANFTYDWESWHDPDGKLVWVNDAVKRMTGFTPSECLQMEDYPLPIVVDDDRSKVEEMLRAAVAGESRNDVEFRIRTAGGEVRWMAVSWQPMHADDGQDLGFRTSVRNITERQIFENS